MNGRPSSEQQSLGTEWFPECIDGFVLVLGTLVHSLTLTRARLSLKAGQHALTLLQSLIFKLSLIFPTHLVQYWLLGWWLGISRRNFACSFCVALKYSQASIGSDCCEAILLSLQQSCPAGYLLCVCGPQYKGIWVVGLQNDLDQCSLSHWDCGWLTTSMFLM